MTDIHLHRRDMLRSAAGLSLLGIGGPLMAKADGSAAIVPGSGTTAMLLM